jgi:hypothetical protein
MVKKLLTEEDCLKIGKVLNHATNRCNKAKPVKNVDKPQQVVKKIQPKVVKVKKILTEEDCLKIGKVLNPKTNRCNKAKFTNVRYSPRKSPSISIKSRSPQSPRSPRSLRSPMAMSSSRRRKLDEFVKKRAARIIQKITSPFINRVSANIEDRIRTYKLYHKYLSKYSTNQCMRSVKKNDKITYLLADESVKIVKQIGTESKHGVIYLSKGSNTGELFRFASKIMEAKINNLYEIQILEKLTKLVIAKKNPHFPIMYYNFVCNKLHVNSDLPAIANNKLYYINLNELANGDVNTFINENYKDHIKIKNAIAQIYIAIYSFHSEGYFHLDSHWGNFLYHKIKPGGYIKYIINGNELYLENIGYLWVIWDFGFSKNIPINNNNMEDSTRDYNRILRAFMNKNIGGWLLDEFPLTYDTKYLVRIIYWLIKTLRTYKPNLENAHVAFFDEFMQKCPQLFLKKKELPADAVIINKGNPYKIG